MKNWILAFSFFLINLISFSQSDSLNTQKWKPQHSVGVELGGGLYPYSLNYQFLKRKNKHQIGGVFKASIFKLPSPLLISQGLFFKYAYGKKHNFTFTTGGGVFIEPKNYAGDFSFKLKNEKVEFYSITNLFGYERQMKKFTLGINFGSYLVIYYNIFFPVEQRIKLKSLPMIGLNFSYNI